MKEAKVYVINLDRRKDRMACIAADLAQIGLTFERVSAAEISKTVFDAYVSKFRAFAKLGGYLPSLGQVSCFLSHRKIWQSIVDYDLSHALVLEDDAVPLNWDPSILQFSLPELELDLLRLESCKDPDLEHDIFVREVLGRKVIKGQTWGSAAYILSNAGARKCLSTAKFWFVVDDYETWSSVYQLRTALLFPQMFRQRDAADTNIESPYENVRLGQGIKQWAARQLLPHIIRSERVRISRSKA